jgi:hypothetical protein
VQHQQPASLSLSHEFRETAIGERNKLIARYEQARNRHEELAQEANQAAREAERYLKTIRELGELLGIEDQLSITELIPELRGERLREVAAEIVFRHFKPGDPPFHYKRWLELVVNEGHRIGGKNPAATFLTQVARVEGIERVGRRTGLYQVADAR